MTAKAPKPNGLSHATEDLAPCEGTVKVLVAEDEPGVRQVIENLLQRWGYSVVSVATGTEAWEVLRGDDPPRLAILDWVMPGLDGLEVCRRVRDLYPSEPPYLIMLTGRRERNDVVAGLEGGADEYLIKPVDAEELRARVQAGGRLVAVQGRLAKRVGELEKALRAGRSSGEDRVGIRTTLRLCIAAINETLSLETIPGHLRATLRVCAGLCLEALGDGEG